MVSWAESYTPDEGTDAPRQVTPDPRPPRRVKASTAQWREIREDFADECCVHCALPNVEALHHIVFRSEGGSDIRANLAPMCRADHTAFHARAHGWERIAASIRKYVIRNNERRHYVEEKLGARFSTRYPPLANDDPQFRADFDAIYGLKGGDQ